jgi:uncharacterized membrane protein YdbT with pleckstrin-like domain
MNRDKFRCHPSIIIENLGALFIVVAIMLVNNIDDIGSILVGIKTAPSLGVFIGLISVIIGMGTYVFIQYRIWYKTLISIDENAIDIERNTINRKHKTYGIKNISNVNLEQNIFEQILGTYKIKIDTDSLSTSNETDIKIVLKKDKALEFKAEVMKLVAIAKDDKEDIEEVKLFNRKDYDVVYSVKDIFLHSFYALPLSSIVSFIIMFALIIVLLGFIDISEDFVDIFIKSLGGLVAILIGIGTSASQGVISFLKFFDFRAKRLGKKIIISQGLLKKRTYEIPIDRINAIKIVEPAISRVFHKKSIELVNVGAGDEKDEGAFLLLSKSNEEIDMLMRTLLPEFITSTDENLRRQPKKAVPIILFHLFLLLAVIIAGYIAFVLSTDFNSNIYLWSGLGVGIMVMLILASEILSYITTGLSVGDDYIAVASGSYKKVTKIIRYEKIQYLKGKGSPLARIQKLQSYRLYILANSQNNINATGLYEMSVFDDIYERM